MQKTAKLQPDYTWGDINLIITDNTGIEDFNQRVFNRSGNTDVISIKYDPMPHISDLTTAEIIVNIELAVEKAKKIAPPWNAQKEFALYVAHGCDHLSGADDATDSERKKMRRRELNWLKELNHANLITNLFN